MKVSKKNIVRLFLISVLVFALYLGLIQLAGNFHSIVKNEAYRSAQLSSDELEKYIKKYGIKSVLNLRGKNQGQDWYEDEVQKLESLGVVHENFKMSSKRKLDVNEALKLVEVMKKLPKPMLIHCRAGADRTGLASALYVAAIAKKSEFEAEMQLSPFYGHVGLWFTSAYAMNKTFEELEPFIGYPDS